MNNSRSEFADALYRFSVLEGINHSPIEGVYCTRYSYTSSPEKRHWRACFAIVAQGCKEVGLESEIYRCTESYYTATPIALPIVSRVAVATEEKPFLALLIDLNPLILNEIASQLDDCIPKETTLPVRALFKGQANEKMLEAATKLANLLQTPEDARVVGPLLVRELFYYLLKGPEGLAIRQFVRSGSPMHSISQAIHILRADLSQEIDVPALAKEVSMSRSAFFQHFKEVTAMSPIQYQKRLRLLEAKRLMIDQGETAECSAFQVGYKSVSQFSREYSRMFGNAPLRDIIHLRRQRELFN